jgi:hypothetical protein
MDRRRRTASALFLALALALATSCSTTHGRFDFDGGASFAAYRSFAIVHPAPAGAEVPLPEGDIAKSQLTERRVREAIERELGAKGLASAPEASADLLVAFNLSSRRATRLVSYPDGFIHAWPHRWWRDHWDEAYTQLYTEGVLIVDLVDAKTRRLVWRGWTANPLPDSGDMTRVVDHAVGEVLENYPPPPGP